MIFPKLQTWTYSSELENLLFFTQRIMELSFDKSDFEEKNQKVDVKDLIKEILDLIKWQSESKKEISNAEFEILFTELIERIHDDDVIKQILGDKKESYVSKLSLGNDIKIIKNTLEVLLLKIGPREYYSKCTTLIKELITTGNKHKDKLHRVTTGLFEFLISYGYQKGTIYFLTNRHFFDRTRKNKITSINDIDAYFSLFDLKRKSFEVVFVGSKIFEEIADSCKKMGLIIVPDREHKYDKNLESKFYRNSNNKKIFLICESVKAVDYLHAMKVAENRVSMVSDLFVVFHHKSKPWHSDYCLVYKHDKENVIKMNKPNNLMTNVSELDISYAKEIFPIFLKRFGLEKDSLNRFKRGVELHALSLETDEAASQILNFWICLEALLITNFGKSHIASVSDSIELIVIHYSLRGKVDNLLSLMKSWSKSAFDTALKKLPDDITSSEENALAALTGIEEFKDIAIELLAQMDEAPLLRFKFMDLVNTLQKKSSIKDLIEKNKVKCKRDIRRVYRARNQIVHQGNINEHNDFVVEIAHHYLDLVLFSIIERKISFDDIQSVDNLLNELQISNEVHNNYINKLGTNKLSRDDFSKVVFGSEH